MAKQVLNAYRLARTSRDSDLPIRFPMEFESREPHQDSRLVKTKRV